MRAVGLLLALVAFALSLEAESDPGSGAPLYSAASIVNAATNQLGTLAPNTIVTIYGDNLSFETRALTAADMHGTELPTNLPGAGVTVLVGNIPAPLYYVSPHQVNLLIPNNLRAGRTRLQLARDGRAGPAVDLVLSPVAPALFQSDAFTAIATRPDGSVLGWESPARPGEIVILYATGLGPTNPETEYGRVPTMAASLVQASEFRVVLNGEPIARDLVDYVGVTPGFAGLYQVNVWLPADTAPNPEIRLAVGQEMSPTGVCLPVAPGQ